MIRRMVKISIPLLILFSGGWYLFHRTEINSFQDAMTLLKEDGNKLMSTIRNVSFNGSSSSGKETIKIASFDLTDFHDGKLETTKTAQTLVEILARFDVVAIQGIQSPDHDALPRLMDQMRRVDPEFDYVIGPRSSHTALNHQFAFIYNRRFVELDRSQVYTIQDPDDVISHDPLVGWFRAKGRFGENESAFTFSLVNIRIDSTNKSTEHRYLQKIKLAVKADGHLEDDILLIGNFEQNSITLQNQKTLPGYDYVIRQDTTDLEGQRQLSNIAFPVQGTSEFTGRTGVLDFLTELNLSLEDAQKVSRHLPIWGEFFNREGAASGYVAGISE